MFGSNIDLTFDAMSNRQVKESNCSSSLDIFGKPIAFLASLLLPHRQIIAHFARFLLFLFVCAPSCCCCWLVDVQYRCGHERYVLFGFDARIHVKILDRIGRLLQIELRFG